LPNSTETKEAGCGKLLMPTTANEGFSKFELWRIVKRKLRNRIVKEEVKKYYPRKLFNTFVQKIVILREIIRAAEGKETGEPHTRVRKFWHTYIGDDLMFKGSF
jgi:hypothetical protein